MTTWLAVALVYASQCLAGELVVRGLWRGARLSLIERAACALLLGPAALAAQMLVMSLVGIPFSLPVVLGPWWVAAGWLLWRRRRRRAAGAPGASGVAPPANVERRASTVTTALAALALVVFAALAWLGWRTPVFESDPINNYAFAARIFETHCALAGDTIASLRAVGHVEYPPLVALNEALIFMAAGEQRLRAVMPFFALPWLAMQLLVISAAGSRLRALWAVPVCLIVMLTPEPFALGTVGLADLRLAATVLLLALQGRALLLRPGGATAVRYAAIAAACALTKNEGIVVAAAAGVPLLWLAVRRRLDARASLGSLALVLVGATIWIAYLRVHGIATGYWRDEAVGTLTTGVPERFVAALEGFRNFSFGSRIYLTSFYGVLWQAGLLAAVIGLLRRASHRETAALVAGLAAQVALYALLLAVLAQPMVWSLQASGLRLFTHIVAWPILLMVAALAGGAPMERPASPQAAAPSNRD